jgi:DNA polymerase III epsilon subunit-like protein
MKNKKFADVKLAFVDTETTGLSVDNHEIIEIGCIIYDQSKDKVLDEWVKKVAPRHIETASQEALEINGYAKNPKAYKGNIKLALLKFNKIINGCMIVGQNVEFDIKFLETAMSEFKIEPSFERHRKIELMSVAWPAVRDTEIEGLGLRNLCDHFKISNAGAHSALVDCRRTLGVYKCLMEIYNANK